ncbi:CLUMA_CG014504, isoform A [Clunio marinus]|uniref:CLUMA_CG014504, isoform A n=1 Tax=Clunio marinus TaxID=568069 RepID=A0A1J1IMA4_9DIPT|nr:CLUMA_CG014504, isoform A [Clunio marinus]
MMLECDLDDNDPLSLYLKKAPMSGTSSNNNITSPTTNRIRDECRAGDNRSDSISDVRRQRSQNINHAVTDAKIDKVEETELIKSVEKLMKAVTR